jgi:hypothetical protein
LPADGGVVDRGTSSDRGADDPVRVLTGPWRYERLTCDHWVPVQAAEELGHLLLDFLS